GHANAPFAEVNAQDARQARSAEAGEGIGDGFTCAHALEDGVERCRSAEQEAAARIASRAALDLEDSHVLTGDAAKQVGEQAGGEEARRPRSSAIAVDLDPVRAVERTNAGVHGHHAEVAPAAVCEQLTEPTPEGGLVECGERVARRGLRILI